MRGTVPQPASHTLPVHETAVQLVGMMDAPRPTQAIPLKEYASVLVPEPPATNIRPFHAMALHWVENIVVDDVAAVQLVPLLEYMIVLVPEPPATKYVPFQQRA